MKTEIEYDIDFSTKKSTDDFTKEELEKIIVKTTEIINTETAKEILSRAYYDRGIANDILYNNEEAISDLTEAICLKCNHLWSAYYSRGIIYYETNQISLALSDFQNALQNNPTFEYVKYVQEKIEAINNMETEST